MLFWESLVHWKRIMNEALHTGTLMSFPKFSPLVLTCLLCFLGNVQLHASVFLGSAWEPFVWGNRGDSDTGGPSIHELTGSLRKIILLVNVTAPGLVLFKTAALCLQTSGWNNLLEPDFFPCGWILKFILDWLLLEWRKAITDMPFLENYKNLGVNKSMGSLASNTLK